MAFTFRRNLKFGINVETTYNTYAAPIAGDGIVILEASFIPVQEWMEETSSNAIPEKKLTDLVNSVKNFTAKIKFKWPKEGAGQLLKNIYGTVADTAVGASFSGTRHIFSASNTTPTSISLLVSDDIQAYQLSGAAVKTFKLSTEIGKPVYAEVDFIGGTWVEAAAGVGSMTTPTTTLATDAYWHFNNITTATILGASITPTSWELTIENTYADGLAESYEIQTTAAATNSRKQLERAGDVPIKYTWTIKRLLQSTTNFLSFQNLSSGGTSFELKQTSGSTATSTGATDYYMLATTATSYMKSYTQYNASDLIGEQLVIEGYQSASTDNQFTYKDKQTVS